MCTYTISVVNFPSWKFSTVHSTQRHAFALAPHPLRQLNPAQLIRQALSFPRGSDTDTLQLAGHFDRAHSHSTVSIIGAIERKGKPRQKQIGLRLLLGLEAPSEERTELTFYPPNPTWSNKARSRCSLSFYRGNVPIRSASPNALTPKQIRYVYAECGSCVQHNRQGRAFSPL